MQLADLTTPRVGEQLGTLRRPPVVIGVVSACALAACATVVGAVPKVGQPDPIAVAFHITGLRQMGAVRVLATLGVFAAMAALLACWWQLRPRQRTAPSHMWLIAAVWAAPLLLAPPLFSADVYAYAGQGHLVSGHIDPYRYGPGAYEPMSPWSFHIDGLWRFAPSPYGPVWLWLGGQIVALSGGHFLVAVYLFRLIALAGCVLLGWSLVQLCGWAGLSNQRALWLALLNPLLLVHGLSAAHNDVLMVAVLCFGLAVAVRLQGVGGLVLAALLVTLAALIKAPAAVALPFLPLLRPPGLQRCTAAALTVVSAGAGAVLLTAATGLGWGWIHVLRHQESRPSVWSLARWIDAAGDSLATAVWPGTPVGSHMPSLVVVAIVCVCAWTRAAIRGQPLAGLGIAFLALMCVGPQSQPWYLMWALVPLAVAAPKRQLLAAAALSTTLALCVMPGGRSWVRPPWFGAPLAIAMTALAAVAYIQRRDRPSILEAAAARSMSPAGGTHSSACS